MGNGHPQRQASAASIQQVYGTWAPFNNKCLNSIQYGGKVGGWVVVTHGIKHL